MRGLFEPFTKLRLTYWITQGLKIDVADIIFFRSRAVFYDIEVDISLLFYIWLPISIIRIARCRKIDRLEVVRMDVKDEADGKKVENCGRPYAEERKWERKIRSISQVIIQRYAQDVGYVEYEQYKE